MIITEKQLKSIILETLDEFNSYGKSDRVRGVVGVDIYLLGDYTCNPKFVTALEQGGKFEAYLSSKLKDEYRITIEADDYNEYEDGHLFYSEYKNIKIVNDDNLLEDIKMIDRAGIRKNLLKAYEYLMGDIKDGELCDNFEKIDY